MTRMFAWRSSICNGYYEAAYWHAIKATYKEIERWTNNKNKIHFAMSPQTVLSNAKSALQCTKHRLFIQEHDLDRFSEQSEALQKDNEGCLLDYLISELSWEHYMSACFDHIEKTDLLKIWTKVETCTRIRKRSKCVVTIAVFYKEILNEGLNLKSTNTGLFQRGLRVNLNLWRSDHHASRLGYARMGTHYNRTKHFALITSFKRSLLTCGVIKRKQPTKNKILPCYARLAFVIRAQKTLVIQKHRKEIGNHAESQQTRGYQEPFDLETQTRSRGRFTEMILWGLWRSRDVQWLNPNMLRSIQKVSQKELHERSTRSSAHLRLENGDNDPRLE